MLSSIQSLMPHVVALGLLLAVPMTSVAQTNTSAQPGAAGPKKIVIIAGKKSHGPEGNGIHDYPWSAKLLKVMLDNSNIRDRVRVEFHLDDWPTNAATLEDAATILMISDGRDGDKYTEAPHFSTAERRSQIEKQIQRGCGFLTFHFSTFAPDAEAERSFEWTGGYFDWETDGKRDWYSAIKTLEAEVTLLAAEHPVLRGVKPFRMKEEFYYNIRFREADRSVAPLLQVAELPGREPHGNVVAWAKERANGGRGFGTTCGHFYENWKVEEFRTLMLNALAWTAHVAVPAEGVRAKFFTHAELTSALAGKSGTEPAVVAENKTVAQNPAASPDAATTPKPATSPRKAETLYLVEGKFSMALNAVAQGMEATGNIDFRQPPFTIELWANLNLRNQFSILAAQEPKTSPTHWELFTMRGTGKLTFFCPGMKPDHVYSDAVAVDKNWRYIAATVESNRVRLYLDGQVVADQAVVLPEAKPGEGKLAFGRLVEGGIGCDGAIDEVRISRGLRDIKTIPDQPFAADDQTLGLWRFDRWDSATGSEDASKFARAAKSPKQTAPPIKDNHWGKEQIGFNWKEQDSIDNRWNETELGSFHASIMPMPNLPPVKKGLSIRLSSNQDAKSQGASTAAVCYDSETMALRSMWTGGFLKFHPARYGLINSPQMAGEPLLVMKPESSWLDQPVQYAGLHRHGSRVILETRVNGTTVFETPSLSQTTNTDAPIIARRFSIAAHQQPLKLLVASPADAAVKFRLEETKATPTASRVAVSSLSQDKVLAIAMEGIDGGWQPTHIDPDGQRLILTLPPRATPLEFTVRYAVSQKDRAPELIAAVTQSAADSPLDEVRKNLSPQWGPPLITQGENGTGPGPYVIDTFTVPFENRFKALFFTSGHDFFSNGDMAVCTVHGDVWYVTGVTTPLKEIRWHRFATGLFQPLGLKIIDDKVYVLGRDQITRLHDRNGDREADFYECFNNQMQTSAGGHDYVACLETDPQGHFYCVHANQGVVRILRDGSRIETVATGFRNPNGMGVGPDGTITVSPQEGHWTPASSIMHIRPGGYYGFGGPRISSENPRGYDEPMCYLPRMEDNSSGGQVWVTSEKWGPLAGQMLHLSYGQCKFHLAIREFVPVAESTANPAARVVQGGTVPFPLYFHSGIMRGRFSPHDGQLYLTGLRGWTTSAIHDGCLQRVRYTGEKVHLPVAVTTWKNGLEIRFSEPLDRTAAQQPDNYHILACNIRYSSAYGSPLLKPSNSQQEGKDEWRVESATLRADGRTVFLEIPQLQPVDFLALKYSLASKEGTAIRNTLNYTIHELGSQHADPATLTRIARRGELPAEMEQRLRPGVVMRRERTESSLNREKIVDVRAQRLWTSTATPALENGGSAVKWSEEQTATGFLKAPLSDRVQLTLRSSTPATLKLNDTVLQLSQGKADVTEFVNLVPGFNRLELKTTATSDSPGRYEILWQGDGFSQEPLPPSMLWFDPLSEELTASEQIRRGRELAELHRCARCHAENSSKSPAPLALHIPGSATTPASGPGLKEIGSRLDPVWMANWLRNPKAIRPQATMPAPFAADDPASSQQIADLVAYLASLKGNTASSAETTGSSGNLKEGERLYEDLGCISCHRFTPPSQPDDWSRRTLHFSGAKFSGESLTAFLLKPQLHFPATRMPDFQLTPAEAASLSAYLQNQATGKIEAAGPSLVGDTERGRLLFQKRNCTACHAVDDSPAPLSSTPHIPTLTSESLKREAGCLAENAESRKSAPIYGFSANDRAALVSYFLAKKSSLRTGDASIAERGLQLVQRLNCIACHSRDGKNSPRAEILAEESNRGLAAEVFPDLTWTGEKLRPEWAEQFLAGKITTKPRTWLKGRMPAFPAYARELAHGLAVEHGRPMTSPSRLAVDPALVELGRKLTQKSGGLDCRQCHGVGVEQPLGDENTKIALGINFVQIRDRMQPEAYRRLVLDPPRFDINSKMPKLSPDGKTTKVTEIFNGDAARQFEALWHYIQHLEDQGDPRK